MAEAPQHVHPSQEVIALSDAIDGFARRIFGDSFNDATAEDQGFMRDIAAGRIANLASLALIYHGDGSNTSLAVIRENYPGSTTLEAQLADVFTPGVPISFNRFNPDFSPKH